MARFVERVPNARAYEATHDFQLWQLDIEHVRYIGGFGRIAWIDGGAVLRDPLGAGLDAAAPGAIAHMNADHRSSMQELWKRRTGATAESVEMVDLDRTGFLLRAAKPDGLAHFSFGREITAAEIRAAVVAVIRG